MKKLFFLSLLLIVLTSCKVSQNSRSIDPKGNYFEVKEGKTFEIQFTTNASLGYAWMWENEKAVSIVESLDSRYVDNNPPGIVGASVQRFWNFRGKEKGTDTLRFNYCRANDPSTSIETRAVVVKVK